MIGNHPFIIVFFISGISIFFIIRDICNDLKDNNDEEEHDENTIDTNEDEPTDKLKTNDTK